MQPLMAGDDGKKVAGDPVQLARFRAVYEKDRPGKDVAERMRRAASDLAAPVRVSQANAKDGSNPSDQVTGELDRLATQLAGLKRVWEQDRRTVDAIVGDCKRDKNAVAAQTLDQAVRADAEALALATATKKERAKVRAEIPAATNLRSPLVSAVEMSFRSVIAVAKFIAIRSAPHPPTAPVSSLRPVAPVRSARASQFRANAGPHGPLCRVELGLSNRKSVRLADVRVGAVVRTTSRHRTADRRVFERFEWRRMASIDYNCYSSRTLCSAARAVRLPIRRN